MPRVSKPPSETTHVLVSLLGTRADANRGDGLATPSAASAWLADQGLLPAHGEVTQTERQRLVDLREGLYALLLAPGRRWSKEAARLFNRTIRDVPLEVFVTSDRAVRIASPEKTFNGALGKIVSFMVDSYFGNQWGRFRACADDECRRVFYDDSRSGTRKWCDGRCGDKVRTRNHRSARRHARR